MTVEPTEATVSVCIVARNEAEKLADCLASVQWAHEVLVMDLESADGSATVAQAHGAQVVRRAPHPVVEPLRDELAAVATGEWVLALDPDERVTPGLAGALRDAARRSDIDAVVIPRMNIDFGWPPEAPGQRYEPQLRMYRRAAVSWPHFPNRLPKVPEDRLLRLPARDELVLQHLRNVSVAETAERLVRYPTVQAQAMLDEGQEFTARGMARALWQQVDRHVIEAKAWREGVPGLVRAGVLLNHQFYTWTALWQLSGSPRRHEDDALVRRLGLVLSPMAAAVRLGRGLRRRRRRRNG